MKAKIVVINVHREESVTACRCTVCVHLTINHSAHHFENCLKTEMCLDMEKNNLIKSANILLCFLIYFVVIFFIKCTLATIKFTYNRNILNEKEVFNEGENIIRHQHFEKTIFQKFTNVLKNLENSNNHFLFWPFISKMTINFITEWFLMN